MKKKNLRRLLYCALILSVTLFYNSCSKEAETEIDEMENNVVSELLDREDFTRLFRQTKAIEGRIYQRMKRFSDRGSLESHEIEQIANDVLIAEQFAELAVAMGVYIVHNERLQDIPLDLGYTLLIDALTTKEQLMPTQISIRGSDDPEVFGCVLTAVGIQELVKLKITKKNLKKIGLKFTKKNIAKVIPLAGWGILAVSFYNCMWGF